MLHRVCYILFALVLFFGCTDGTERRLQLEELERQNRADSLMTNDSLARDLADYFDRNGTSNEQLRAHYILGRTYADKGETPRALDSYQTAATRADTTAADCDYATLGRVYSQMSGLFHQQLLFANEITARNLARRYFLCAKDTFYAIYHKGIIAGTYIIMNKRDSAEILLRETMRQYRAHGYEQNALQTSTMLMHIYIDQLDHQFELKQLIDQYEQESELFDKYHELPPSKRQFFYYKGKYYENINRLDSAEYYYRKVYGPNMSYSAKNPMYKGLLNVFKKRHQADSIAKYSQLYCETNDSSIAIKDQQQTAQLAASYNYTHYQREARNNAEKAHKREIALILFAAIVAIVTIIIIHLANSYRKRQQKRREELEAAHKESLNRLKAEHQQATKAYDEKLEQLQQIEQKHQRTINTIQSELGKTKSENQDIMSENAESKRIIEQLNAQYHEEASKLKGEIEQYIEKVEGLERQIVKLGYRQRALPFFSLGIVKRVKLFAENSQKQLSENDLNMLASAVNDFFPELICDLNSVQNVSELGKRVCFLVALHLHTSDISHLLDISPQQVGNIKKNINSALFHEETAITLSKNLTMHYKILPYES